MILIKQGLENIINRRNNYCINCSMSLFIYELKKKVLLCFKRNFFFRFTGFDYLVNNKRHCFFFILIESELNINTLIN